MRVAVLWSGGKESCLACHKVITQGYDVAYIVTFIWDKPFLCHSLPLMSLQSTALGIPHLKIKVQEPYRKGYMEAIFSLMKTGRIEGIVTGDISIIDNVHGDWIGGVCEEVGIDIIRPLWGMSRHRILEEVILGGFRAIFTCVRRPWFDEEWLGRELDIDCLKSLKALSDEYGIDLCGENGEYHTMVVDAPIFKEKIEISKFSKEEKKSLLFLSNIEFSLKPKFHE